MTYSLQAMKASGLMVALAMVLAMVLAGGTACAQPPGISVDVFPGSETYPRNTEGSLIVLEDGTYLVAESRFHAPSDHAEAHIAGRTSEDGGKTWSEPFILQENIGGRNVMSVSFMRLKAPRTVDGETELGPIGMFFLVKNSLSDCQVYMRVSEDEGETWSEPRAVTDEPGYHVMNNDRVYRTSTGRLICPIAWTSDVGKVNHFECFTYFSDDAGKTWQRGEETVDLPKRGAMEPEVIEKDNGDILMLMRTQMSRNYAAISTDGGNTWGEPQPFGPPAPEAPSTLREMPSTGDWLLIFNDSIEPGHHHGGPRTPLTAAVTTDEGETWGAKKNIESNPDETYSYTSLVFHDERALMTYYVQQERSSLRFRSIPVDWFYDGQ